MENFALNTLPQSVASWKKADLLDCSPIFNLVELFWTWTEWTSRAKKKKQTLFLFTLILASGDPLAHIAVAPENVSHMHLLGTNTACETFPCSWLTQQPLALKLWDEVQNHFLNCDVVTCSRSSSSPPKMLSTISCNRVFIEYLVHSIRKHCQWHKRPKSLVLSPKLLHSSHNLKLIKIQHQNIDQS